MKKQPQARPWARNLATAASVSLFALAVVRAQGGCAQGDPGVIEPDTPSSPPASAATATAVGTAIPLPPAPAPSAAPAAASASAPPAPAVGSIGPLLPATKSGGFLHEPVQGIPLPQKKPKTKPAPPQLNQAPNQAPMRK